MADNGFIKLYKKMLKWEWYDDINTKVLFFHCLLRANWCPTRWHGVELQAGQFVTSLASLAKETKLTVRQVRVALDHLIMTGEVTSKCQSKYRIITVNSWNEYQGNDKQVDKQMTNKRQANDKQVTTDKEIKEIKEVKNINIDVINKYSLSFNEFWDAYPRKQDKGQAYKCYQARLNDGYTEEQLLTACKNYAEECEREKREKKFTKVASTFLSVNEPFVEYLEKGGNANEQSERRTSRDSKTDAEREEEMRRIIEYSESEEGKREDAELWEGFWDNINTKV